MSKNFAVAVVIILMANYYSCVSKQTASTKNNNEAQPPQTHITSTAHQAEVPQIKSEPTRAEKVMTALYKAYPDHIITIEFKNDDWAVLLRNPLGKETWYYFAEGRLLPEDLKEKAASYRPVQFYNYPEDLPAWKPVTAEEAARYQGWAVNRRQNTAIRSSFFLDDLFQGDDREKSNSSQTVINFLGKSTKVHRLIKDKMAKVETRILETAKTNSDVKTWINNIGTFDGWGWRNIADSGSRSYHSYGLAVDILPRSYGGKQTYWLWTSQYRDDWWNVSYNERYHPPLAVIKIFESYGFVWGGKWEMFDTMHFEYRPEVIILNSLNMSEDWI